MREDYIEEMEWNEICRHLKLDTEMRNKLLTFSFMAVMAALGIAFSLEKVDVFIFVLPFFVIIPFTAKLGYYRKVNAHLSAFLEVYAQEQRKYEICTRSVKIDRGFFGTIIAWLVNYEMFLLALMCMILFYMKYPTNLENFVFEDCLYCAMPLLLTIFEFCLITSTYNYNKIKALYYNEFNNHKISKRG